MSNYLICFLGLTCRDVNVIVVQLHKYLVPLCIRRRFDQFLSKRKLGPILYVRSRPGLSTIPAGPTELGANWWHHQWVIWSVLRPAQFDHHIFSKWLWPDIFDFFDTWFWIPQCTSKHPWMLLSVTSSMGHMECTTTTNVWPPHIF